MSVTQSSLRIGVDIGGTFTDFVVFHPESGRIHTFKQPSTPANPEEAVLQGLERIRRNFPASSWAILHGSTVATNALLEGKGAPTALVTTSGFKDMLQIGRQNRPRLYDFASAPPEPLVPAEWRLEVSERVGPRGEVIEALAEKEIEAVVAQLKKPQPADSSPSAGVESIAVVTLFSFANPEHERRLAEALRAAGFFVSASHEILPAYREYERASTTVVNAYVSPVLDRYLACLEDGLQRPHAASQFPPADLQIMQSNGGSIRVEEARRAGVRCILSGPAGGVVGAQYVLQTLGGQPRALTFDMGGTSTDVCLIDGAPQVTSEARVGGYPIALPLLDIHTIGAGGGSIASIDAGGALRVGPQSAGADPGPACYGRTGDVGKRSSVSGHQSPIPTVTDANLLLGRIPADEFLGGAMPLYPEHAEAAITPLARRLGLSPIETALGIVEIANAHMERALRVISVERGRDPREFTLLSFGGAGGLHAADLARRLGIPKVIISPYASTFSAFGMLAADVIRDYTQTVMLPGDTPLEELQERFAPLLVRGQDDLLNQGIPTERVQLHSQIDLRYRGQSYELTVPFEADFRERFHQAHTRAYGFARPEAALEIVNLRLRAVGRQPAPKLDPLPNAGPDPVAARLDTRAVVYPQGIIEAPFYRGEALQPENRLSGPAVIVRADTTILLGAEDHAVVDPFLNLHIHVEAR